MKVILLIMTTLLISACHYKSFIGYALNKKGFKHFSKKERFVGSNENPLRKYDVSYYDWQVELNLPEKSLSGRMKIELSLLDSQKDIMLDLHSSMKVDSIFMNGQQLSYKHARDLIYLNLDSIINNSVELSIFYHGKPKSILKDGPIQWKQDSLGRDWISTQTEGIGPQFIMPCNALLRDEPDSCTIAVVVPKELTAVANGKFISENKVGHGKKEFKYHVSNPINIYNISFNVGHVEPIEISYKTHTITCWPLDYHREQAKEFYTQLPRIFTELEAMYGEYPWWNDGAQFVESTFSAMEHQSCIAMGSEYDYDWKEYNLTLIHELSHEWWGNKLTGYDYCDMWIHEGMATYSEALVVERIYGKEEYAKRLYFSRYFTRNKIPIHKECGVLYNSWSNQEDQDIYPKGALLMHSVRVELDNDELFFDVLKKIQQEYAPNNLSTAEFCALLNRHLQKDFTELFSLYLDQAIPPTLDLFVEKTPDSTIIYYKWQNENMFELNKGLVYTINHKKHYTHPTNEFQKMVIPADAEFVVNVEESIYYVENLLKKM